MADHVYGTGCVCRYDGDGQLVQPCEYHLRQRHRQEFGRQPIGGYTPDARAAQTPTVLIPGVGWAIDEAHWAGPQVRVLTPEEAYGPLPNKQAAAGRADGGRGRTEASEERGPADPPASHHHKEP